jgi:alpha-N-acetylglucosaminidase
MLHNFGGRRALYGNLSEIATGPISARTMNGSTMIGTGLTPEAIEQNPIMYTLMFEMGWRSEEFDLEEWLQMYISRRYVLQSEQVYQAWDLLRESVYSNAQFPLLVLSTHPIFSNTLW